MSVTSEIARARSLIRVVPDHPSPGVAFQDITPLLADARALRAVSYTHLTLPTILLV